MDNELSDDYGSASDGVGEQQDDSEGELQDADDALKSEGTEVSGDEGDESSEGEPDSKKKSVDKKVKLFDERYFEVEDEPPKLVVVQGPPQSGKTTLIKCLIKHYTKQTVSDPKGDLI